MSRESPAEDRPSRSGAAPSGGTADEELSSDEAGGYQAVAELYHAYLTGLLLMAVSRRGGRDAAELVFGTFRRQHLRRFSAGLDKLGLRGLPDAVACAQYHYLSNQLGGVKVEYVYERDDKAWIRYPPPRWIFAGTAICGIPSEVSRAMLRGWHAHNGVTLGNARLGFVCTQQTVDGQPGLAGYYLEHDHDLAPDERLQFRPGEPTPRPRPGEMPVLASSEWPLERRRKAERNYCMDYIGTILPLVVELWGPAEGGSLAGLAARQIGMHLYDRLHQLLGLAGTDSGRDFETLLTKLTRAQGDAITIEGGGNGSRRTLHQHGWRLMRDVPAPPDAVFAAWVELYRGLLAACDPTLSLHVERNGAADFVWSVT